MKDFSQPMKTNDRPENVVKRYFKVVGVVYLVTLFFKEVMAPDRVFKFG